MTETEQVLGTLSHGWLRERLAATRGNPELAGERDLLLAELARREGEVRSWHE